jgi:large subunit ribosomal protein L30
LTILIAGKSAISNQQSAIEVEMSIKIKQIKSTIARPESQVKILRALGLGRIGKTVELKDNESVRGMVAKVKHLVEVI